MSIKAEIRDLHLAASFSSLSSAWVKKTNLHIRIRTMYEQPPHPLKQNLFTYSNHRIELPKLTTDKMKLTAATIISTVYASTAFASNVSCVYQKGTKGDHIVGLKGAVQAYGGQYHVSGRSGSTFATYGSAKLTLRRTGDHPSVNSYTDATTVANKIQEIIDCCYNHGYTECVGNGDIISFSDGGHINVNVAHN